MLPLIAGYDHTLAVISLPPRVLRYSRGQAKARIATVPAELPSWSRSLNSIHGKSPSTVDAQSPSGVTSANFSVSAVRIRLSRSGKSWGEKREASRSLVLSSEWSEDRGSERTSGNGARYKETRLRDETEQRERERERERERRVAFPESR